MACPAGHRSFAALRRAALAASLLFALSHGPASAAEPPPSEPVVPVEGTPYLSATSLARLLGATRFWRGDVRKMVLRAGSHRVVLTVDNPFVMFDRRTVRLAKPVRMLGGEIHVPVALVDSLPRDTTIARLAFEPRGRRVVLVPPGGVIGSPRVVQSEAVARVTFACDRPEDAKVVGRARGHFRLRIDGFFAGLLPDSMPPPALLRTIHEISAATGSGFELEIGPEAEGWRLLRSKDRITLEIVRVAGPDHESFAPEGPPGPRALRVVVLDPGHGGADAGVTAGETQEKRLTLKLAVALKPELERRLRARVFLTRVTDAGPSADERAEIANRVHADLVLSLHFDGVPGTRARGVTAFCPPATFGARERVAMPGLSAPVDILPWRDVATRHAVRSRDIAETLLATLELRGMGPARLRESLPHPLLGVNAPGLLLECGTLTSAADRARLATPRGIADLAAAIAEGVERWQEERK
ncbi:MAG: N-acetylmuramoyl-L-alanine amidase [Candidatus Eisenbacteria bacterium]